MGSSMQGYVYLKEMLFIMYENDKRGNIICFKFSKPNEVHPTWYTLTCMPFYKRVKVFFFYKVYFYNC